MTVDVPLLHGAVHECEFCHHPDVGQDRCPHAMGDKYPCKNRKPRPVKGNNPYVNRRKRMNNA
ncbi:hypothetical protein [Bifidobacterium sp.]|jgi:hypothetical protein|uniref:hypothetical protein n=1 Tax=Bifidobacterium sp. TaxID=41200 RepID=UPI0025B83F4A|nr:hypothetical protein [Bifidobacterium sp.]MCI1635175.1 hypothetical protein [Bifidobacterium sp.]